MIIVNFDIGIFFQVFLYNIDADWKNGFVVLYYQSRIFIITIIICCIGFHNIYTKKATFPAILSYIKYIVNISLKHYGRIFLFKDFVKMLVKFPYGTKTSKEKITSNCIQ